MALELITNLKLISGTERVSAPTTDELPLGYMAFGIVNGRASVWGNYNNEVVDLVQAGQVLIEIVQVTGQSTTAVISQKGVTDAIEAAKTEIEDSLGTAAAANTGTAQGDVPVLGANGKLADSVIPAVAITETFVVDNEEAMLALSAQTGDVAIRTDVNKSFVLQTAPATSADNWKELLTPTDSVLSVNGKTGNVTLSKTDVGLSNVDNTSDMNKPVSTAQATAIADAKQAGTNAQNAIDTHAAKVDNPHNVTAAQVGAYVKPVSGIPETDLSAEVQDKLNSGGGGGGSVNLLQSSVTANRQAGVVEGDMVNLGYALGLEEGKEYTVKYRFNGSDIVATAKYEAPAGLPLEGGELCLCQSISAEGMTMTFPMLLGVSPYNVSVEDYQAAAISYGYLFIVDKHKITGDMTYSDDENNASIYTRAVQSANAQNAVNVEITAIEPPTEVVADKVKNALTIGDVVFDGSAAKTVDLSKMSVGNATNIIPDENGAVNPGGRGEGTVGNNSTALGNGASAGTRSTALGYNASASGMDSTALGNSASAGRDNSMALGYNASADGTSSTALGNSASASGQHSIALGYNASADGTSSTALGSSASASGKNSTALGYNAIASESDSNVIQLGNTLLSALRCKVNLTVTSDKRDKADINNIINALPFIEKLNPITFVSNDREKYISDKDKKSENYRKYGMCEYDRIAHAAGTKKGERRRCGLLAQEVVTAMQEVYGTDNYANIVNDNFHDLQEKPSDVENKYTLAYANLVPFLIGAIKELKNELNAKIKSLEDKLNGNL